MPESIYKQAEWGYEEGRIAINAARELDSLWGRRKDIAKGIDTGKPKIDLSKTYPLVERLNQHQRILKKIAVEGKESTYYSFYDNPLVGLIEDLYKIKSETYEQLADGLATGLEDITRRFEKIDEEPTKVPIPEIENLMKISLSLYYTTVNWQRREIDSCTLSLAA